MLIGGKNPVYEALLSDFPVEVVYLSNSLSDKLFRKELVRRAKVTNVRVHQLNKLELDKIMPNFTHQGVIAQVSNPKTISLSNLQSELSKTESGLLLAADKVVDPHNLGALLRSAEACGVNYLILPYRRTAEIGATVAKSSTGALFRVNVCRANMARALDSLKKIGFWVIGASGEGKNYWQVNYGKKLVLVVGSEGKGLSKLVKRKCDQLVSIPQYGHLSSLNVSVAGALILYEIKRQQEYKD